MSSTVATSLLGYLFWLVVARTADADVSGIGVATTSALQMTAIFASVGAGTAMLQWLPQACGPAQWQRIFTAGVVVALATSLTGSVVVVLILGRMSSILPTLDSPAAAAFFCSGAVLFAVGTVLDHVAVSERRSILLLARNVLLCSLRTPLLFVPFLVRDRPNEILVAWTVAAALSLPPSLLLFTRDDSRRLRPAFGHVVSDIKAMVPSLVGQHLISVAAVLTTFLLPVVVLARTSEADAAYYYAAWMLGGIFFMVSPSVATSLFAEGSADPARIHVSVVRCCRIITISIAPLIVFYLVCGGWLLQLFGPAYEQNGRALLLVLTFSAIPDAVTNVAVAVLRSTNRLGAALRLNTAMLVVCLVLSWLLLPSVGIVAVGIAWIVSRSAGAVWVAVQWRSIMAAPGEANGARADTEPGRAE